MKILLLNDYGAPTGGAELSLVHLRKGLRDRGHEAQLFTSRAGAPGVADRQCFGTTSRWRTLLQVANFSARRELAAALAEFRPDVVHVRMFLTQLSPLILPLLRDVPTVFHVAWYRPICPTGTKMLPDGSPCHVRWGKSCYQNGCVPLRDWPVLMWQMNKWWQHRGVFRRVVVESDVMQRAMVSAGLTPTDIIPPGVPVPKPRGPLAETPVVAFAGRLVREKGVDVLLRAMVLVPGAQLLILGDGPARQSLEQLCRELNLTDRVTFTGHMSSTAAEHQLARAWVQAVPSVWAEPFGLVAIEAAMRGTAIVVSQTGGMAETVEHEQTGLLVPPGDVPALAAALQRFVADREFSERLGRVAREAALAKYAVDRYVERFIELYEELRIQPVG